MDDNKVCCAHRYLVHVTKRYMNGCQNDHWECQDCGVHFIPRLPPTTKLVDLPVETKTEQSPEIKGYCVCDHDKWWHQMGHCDWTGCGCEKFEQQMEPTNK